MNGFLGTSASVWSDLSLVVTLVLGAVAIFGAIRARQKRFSSHCPVIAGAALINWIPVLWVMIPGSIGVVTGAKPLVTGTLAVAPVFHGLLGAVTQLLMTYTVIRMYLLKQLPPDRPIWLMRSTLALWMLALIGGVGVYVVSFVI